MQVVGKTKIFQKVLLFFQPVYIVFVVFEQRFDQRAGDEILFFFQKSDRFLLRAALGSCGTQVAGHRFRHVLAESFSLLI